MLSRDVQVLKNSTEKHIRMKLELELGNSIHVFPDNKEKLLVVPDNVKMQDIVAENQILQRDLNVWKTIYKYQHIKISIIDWTSSHILFAIRKNVKPTHGLTTPLMYANNASMYQITLNVFYAGLFTDDPEDKCLSQRVKMLIQSFSQDIIYGVTCGKHKPPKHLLLPYAVNTLTGNVEVIQTLNILGVSYSHLEEKDSPLCLQKLAATMNQQVILPVAFRPSMFTILAWDNIDRLEETLTGKGTSHRVNGIAVQGKVYRPHLPKANLPNIEKQKQRTVSTEHQELEVYVASERVGPQPLIIRATGAQ